MHHSRLCAVLIDCKTSDVDEAAHFWSEALGRAVDSKHPGTRGNYRMLETPPDEPIVQIQRVDHESRVHIDIETDDIPPEVTRLEKLGAKVVDRLERWVVMQAPTGQRFCMNSLALDFQDEIVGGVKNSMLMLLGLLAGLAASAPHMFSGDAARKVPSVASTRARRRWSGS